MTRPVVAHPPWCDLVWCTVIGETGEHRSAPLPAQPTDAPATVTVWLEGVPETAGGLPARRGVFLLMDIEQDGQRGVYLFPMGQAALIARQVRVLVDQAKEPGPPR